MDGLHHAAACQQSSENRHDKGKDDQHHIPDLQHAFLFLDHDGMQKRGSNEPRHHRGVLNRIPCPEAAPTQFVVCPFTAKHDSDTQKHPRDHRPAARRTNPCIAKLLGNHGGDGECKGNRKADKTEIQHRRMNHHIGVLQQGIQTIPVVGHERQRRCVALQEHRLVEGVHDEQMHRGEEERRPHQHGNDVRHHRAVFSPILNNDQRRIGREQPPPEQQRSFLPAPDRADLEIYRQVAIGMRRDVLDREITDGEQIPEASDRRRDAHKRAERGIPAAGDQVVVFETNSKQGGNDRIRRHHPCEGQGELADLCHVSRSFSRRLRTLSHTSTRTWPASCSRRTLHHGQAGLRPQPARGLRMYLEGHRCPRILR